MTPASGTATIRRADHADIDGMSQVFGEAFSDYRMGLGVDAPSLARLWRGSLAARVPLATVATEASGDVIGFAIVVMPGEEEFPRSASPRERPRFHEVLGWRGLWRLPATFIPMGLAFARRRTRPDEAYLSFLAVAPRAQGRGVGSGLLAAIESQARRAQAAGILLHTARNNVMARRVYGRAGYDVVATTRSPWTGPNGIDGYVAMLRPLS